MSAVRHGSQSSAPAKSAASAAGPRAVVDAAEFEQLITTNLPLVGHIVRETMARVPSHVCRDDLSSAGMEALVQAARGFDAERGVPFARYAATRIRGAVLDELRRVDWASRSVRRRARDVEEMRQRLAVSLGRVPSTAEVASALGMDEAEVARTDADVSRAHVLSLQGAQDNESELVVPSSGPSPEQVAEHQEQLTYLAEAVTELPDRLRVVVEQYFLAERPMAEIAEELGVTESRVSQMRGEALALLKGALHRELEPDLVTEEVKPGAASRRRESYYAAVAARHAASLRRPLTAMPNAATNGAPAQVRRSA